MPAILQSLSPELGCDAARGPLALTHVQREALLELGTRGSSGLFDPLAMSSLYVMELVDVRDRRVVLTERGQRAYARLCPASANSR